MSDNDTRDIINTLIAEAIGEGPEGMRRVGETILNRSTIRGLTPAQVVRQPSQYTGYSSPGAGAVRAQNNPASRAAAEAAWALAQQPGDPTGGADHYFNPSIVQPSWARGMTPAGTYGGHAFYLSDQAPRVATRLDVGTPTPATPSPFMSAQRNANGLPAYDSLAINPVRGNGAGAMQPAPQPAQQSLALASIRAAEAANTSPALRAALNSYAMTQQPQGQPTRLPPIQPPSSRTPARIDPVGGAGLSYGMLQDTFPARTPSNREQQRSEQALLRRQAASPNQQLRAGLSGNTTPTQAQVNAMYAGGSVFPVPLNYAYAPQPATMSTDMAMMRNTPNLMRQDQVAGGRPIPATMPSGIAAQRANGVGIGGPDMAMAPFPQTQSANLMLSRDPAMAGLIPMGMTNAQLNQQTVGYNPNLMSAAQAAALTGRNDLQPMLPRTPEVGTVLGLGANRGGVVQGFNGLLNSTTQSSDYWNRATGKSSGRRSDGNESLSLGV